VPVLDVAILGLVPFILNVASVVPVSVGLPRVIVPVLAPIPIVVAAPNRLPVKALVLNTLAVPVLVVAILGSVPFILKAVALAAVIVALRRFMVPLLAPILISCPVVKIFVVPVVTFELSVTVPVVPLPLIVNVLLLLDDPSVRVVADAALAARFILVAAPNALTVVDVVFAILAVAADVTRSCSVNVESTVAVP